MAVVIKNKEPRPEPIMRVERGDFFRHIEDNEIYIVARLDSGKYTLVCLNDGANWTDEKTNPRDLVACNSFEKIEDLEIHI